MYPDLPNHEFARIRYAEVLRYAGKRHELHVDELPPEPQRDTRPSLLARTVARLPTRGAAAARPAPSS